MLFTRRILAVLFLTFSMPVFLYPKAPHGGSVSELDVVGLCKFLNIPAEFTIASKWNDKYVVVLFDNKSQWLSDGTDFNLYLLEITDSGYRLLATIDKTKFGGGRDYRLDLAKYRINDKEMLIGLRYEIYPTKVNNEYLSLLRIIKDKIVPVLEIEMKGSDYDYTENGVENGRNFLVRTLRMSENRTNGNFDIISNATIDARKIKRQTIKWNGMRYLVPKNFIGGWLNTDEKSNSLDTGK